MWFFNNLSYNFFKSKKILINILYFEIFYSMFQKKIKIFRGNLRKNIKFNKNI